MFEKRIFYQIRNVSELERFSFLLWVQLLRADVCSHRSLNGFPCHELWEKGSTFWTVSLRATESNHAGKTYKFKNNEDENGLQIVIL